MRVPLKKRVSKKPKSLNLSLGELINRSSGLGALEQELASGVLKDRFTYFAVVVSLITIVAQVALIVFSLGKLPFRIPIFYSLPWGEQVLSAGYMIWVLPILNFVFTALDFILVSRINNDKFLPRVLSGAAILISFVCLYGTWQIISLLT